ncbi:MAG: ABC transporter ATP-binding protein [Holophagales bacterium]|nr:ABC transporter ATP-binding protein [Holophagales bacterium]MYH26270.1 ABC transporter ATP-binding protein [Holophagales bacterium]
MSTVQVEVQDLSKNFFDQSRGEVRAVQEVNFECRSSEIFGLLGANGAGKTTTLRMISTVLQPTAGTARVLGHDVVSDPVEVRRNLGFYSASTALYPRLTARETLTLFARVNKYPAERTRSRVEEMIERFGLGDYAGARIEKLSSGMKQKVSIARTVVHDPPVLIFDEPTVGLDVLNALDLQKAIQELREDGKAILFSTHIMSEAERLCDRIAIIDKGRIRACDDLEGLRAATSQHYLEDIFVHYVTGNDTTG